MSIGPLPDTPAPATDALAAVPAAPSLRFFARIAVEVDAPVDLGRTVDGARRVVPIRGGRVTGDGWSGRVLDAGADFQLYPADDVARLRAMYVLEADDGARLFVDNDALRAAAPEDLEALMSGRAVDPSRVYFRCAPRITADVDGPFAWVNTSVFVGTGTRRADSVLIDVFAVE